MNQTRTIRSTQVCAGSHAGRAGAASRRRQGGSRWRFVRRALWTQPVHLDTVAIDGEKPESRGRKVMRSTFRTTLRRRTQLSSERRSHHRWASGLCAVATATVAVSVAALSWFSSPARAEDLTPTAKFAVIAAHQLSADETKRLVRAYRLQRARTPAQNQAALMRAVAAPPVCRSAFPPGMARNVCAQMLNKIRTGGKSTAKCAAGVVAVVARPAGKTVAFLAKHCGPPAAALAVGAAVAYLNKHCKAITPRPVEFVCDLLF
jgi:hypothetical protein